MWSTSMLKTNAKAALKAFYWQAVVASLIVSLLAGGGGGSSAGRGASDSVSDSELDSIVGNLDGTSSGEFAGFIIGAVIGVLIVMGIIMVIAFAYSAFVAAPIKVGENRFYLDGRRGDVSIGKVFYQFGNGRYLATVKTMFFMTLKIFLWSLLFVIPGIVKTYEYYLVPYILAENPNISRERAFEISRQTMEGEKMNVFGMELSFIGWWFLGAITFIGVFFVTPYFNATKAEFYCCMREKALSRGIASPSELCDDFSQPYSGGGFVGGANGYAPTQPPYPQQDTYQQDMNYAPYQSTGTAGVDLTKHDTPAEPKKTEMDEISFNSDDDSYNGPEIK